MGGNHNHHNCFLYLFKATGLHFNQSNTVFQEFDKTTGFHFNQRGHCISNKKTRCYKAIGLLFICLLGNKSLTFATCVGARSVLDYSSVIDYHFLNIINIVVEDLWKTHTELSQQD